MKHLNYIKQNIAQNTANAVMVFVSFMLICSIMFFYITLTTDTRAQGYGIPFGGYVVYMTYCTCSLGLSKMIYALDEVVPYEVRTYEIEIVWQYPTTIPYTYYQFYRTDVWTLGTYTPGGLCYVGVYPYCTTGSSPQGTMTQEGTSF